MYVCVCANQLIECDIVGRKVICRRSLHFILGGIDLATKFVCFGLEKATG